MRPAGMSPVRYSWRVACCETHENVCNGIGLSGEVAAVRNGAGTAGDHDERGHSLPVQFRGALVSPCSGPFGLPGGDELNVAVSMRCEARGVVTEDRRHDWHDACQGSIHF
jgi:hypothetical protein